MLTFFAFLLTLAGSANWLMIGLLQYDFIAGFFGYQGSVFSRIIYIIFGIGAVYLLIRVIVNKGIFKVYEKKKDKEEQTANLIQTQQQNTSQPAVVNVEASQELPTPQITKKTKNKKKWWIFGKKHSKKHSKKHEKTDNLSKNTKIITQTPPPITQTSQTETTEQPQQTTEQQARTTQQTNTQFTQQANLFDEHFK